MASVRIVNQRHIITGSRKRKQPENTRRAAVPIRYSRGSLTEMQRRGVIAAQREVFRKIAEVEKELESERSRVSNLVVRRIERLSNNDGIVPVHKGVQFMKRGGELQKIFTEYSRRKQRIIAAGIRFAVKAGLGAMTDPIERFLKEHSSKPGMKAKLDGKRATVARQRAIKSALESIYFGNGGFGEGEIREEQEVNAPPFQFAGPLSGRIWPSDEKTRQELAALLNRGINEEMGTRGLRREVRQYMLPGAPKRADERIARTEISNGFFRGEREYAMSKPWIIGMRWHLSAGHSQPCICEANDGKVFDKSFQFHPLHPNDMCFLTAVFDETASGLAGIEGVDFGDEKPIKTQREFLDRRVFGEPENPGLSIVSGLTGTALRKARKEAEREALEKAAKEIQ